MVERTIFGRISGPEYFYCHPFYYCDPSSNINCLGILATQLKHLLRPEIPPQGKLYCHHIYKHDRTITVRRARVRLPYIPQHRPTQDVQMSKTICYD